MLKVLHAARVMKPHRIASCFRTRVTNSCAEHAVNHATIDKIHMRVYHSSLLFACSSFSRHLCAVFLHEFSNGGCPRRQIRCVHVCRRVAVVVPPFTTVICWRLRSPCNALFLLQQTFLQGATDHVRNVGRVVLVPMSRIVFCSARITSQALWCYALFVERHVQDVHGLEWRSVASFQKKFSDGRNHDTATLKRLHRQHGLWHRINSPVCTVLDAIKVNDRDVVARTRQAGHRLSAKVDVKFIHVQVENPRIRIRPVLRRTVFHHIVLCKQVAPSISVREMRQVEDFHQTGANVWRHALNGIVSAAIRVQTKMAHTIDCMVRHPFFDVSAFVTEQGTHHNTRRRMRQCNAKKQRPTHLTCSNVLAL